MPRLNHRDRAVKVEGSTEENLLTNEPSLGENAPVDSQEGYMEYEVGPDSEQPERWVAQAIDWDNEGQVYTALFIGRDAETRARQYADWQNAARKGVQRAA